MLLSQNITICGRKQACSLNGYLRVVYYCGIIKHEEFVEVIENVQQPCEAKKSRAWKWIIVIAVVITVTYQLYQCSGAFSKSYMNAKLEKKPSGQRGTTENITEEEQLPEASVPTELHGIVATIRNPDRLSLSDKPLRLEYALKNTSTKPVVLYDLANCVIPSLQGQWLCVAGGPSSERPAMTLVPGESVSRWVELTRGQPTKDWLCRINVRSEGTGVGYGFVYNVIPTSVGFRIGYDDKIFTGDIGDSFAPVVATPWLEIQLENK
jgi:hypothetical protein